ncbi:hypothetical protein BJY01DRAFT_248891 [Aspergillus pseudoustus]|uniref:Mid2 domain-containing protein n=1 Tax=Aspergillus pseudoustus TaxID=1810923 RepID=A0ABR4JRQ9_9EURO
MTLYFSDFYFTSNLTSFACPGFGDFQCLPPKACARDPNTGTGYCCDPASDSTVANGTCWGLPSDCTNDNRQLQCRSGSTNWCCLYETEECTEVPNQQSICWNQERSPLRNISVDILEDLYSSLAVASPSARTWDFDPATLLPDTSTSTSTTSSTSTSASVSTPTTADTATSSPSSIPDTDSSDSVSLSGGAIAGIVVGAVAGLMIVAVGAFFMLKRRRRRQGQAATAAAGFATAELADGTQPKERFHEVDSTPVKTQTPQELPAH